MSGYFCSGNSEGEEAYQISKKNENNSRGLPKINFVNKDVLSLVLFTF